MTYNLIDRLADLGMPSTEEAIAELTAKDALIRELVGVIRRNWSGEYWRSVSHEHAAEVDAAIARAKEMGYE